MIKTPATIWKPAMAELHRRESSPLSAWQHLPSSGTAAPSVPVSKRATWLPRWFSEQTTRAAARIVVEDSKALR